MGGLDLCFGRFVMICRFQIHQLTFLLRWDTPQHVLVDDPENSEDTIWPGKANLSYTRQAWLTMICVRYREGL